MHTYYIHTYIHTYNHTDKVRFVLYFIYKIFIYYDHQASFLLHQGLHNDEQPNSGNPFLVFPVTRSYPNPSNYGQARAQTRSSPIFFPDSWMKQTPWVE